MSLPISSFIVSTCFEHYLPLLYIPFAIIIIVGLSYLIQKGYDKVFSSKMII